jgi:hypothetical protein
MKEFADSSLGPSCSCSDNAELCSEEQLTEMKEWAAKPDELKALNKRHWWQRAVQTKLYNTHVSTRVRCGG